MSISCPEAVHISTLKYMAESPRHYKWHRDHGTEETDPMRKGSAAHSLVLGGADVVVYEGRRDERIEAWRTFKETHEAAGDIILTKVAMAQAEAMANAVLQHPEASRLLRCTWKERHIDWKRGSMACCSRLDAWNTSDRYILDLKSCRNANPAVFERAAFRYSYNAQLSWYLEAASWFATNEAVQGRASPTPPKDAYIIAVESVAPFDVVVWHLTERALDLGTRAATLWFEKLMVCQDSDHWPGYSEAVLDLDAPVEEEELDFSEGDEG